MINERLYFILSFISLVLLCLIVFILGMLFLLATAEANPFRSAEQTLQKASNLETWQQQLRYYEQQLGEREQTVFGKLEEAQQQHQQGMQQAAEREAALRRSLRQQQEQARNQAFQNQLQQQQEAARQRETALQRQLDEAQDAASRQRLQDLMNAARAQDEMAKAIREEQGTGSQAQEKAYGYTDKVIPGTETGTVPQSGFIGAVPQLTAEPEQPEHITLVLEAPEPIPTIEALNTKVQTTINGIDRIETRAILPENLSVEQLEAVKQIADNGTLIAQQRLGLEQYQIGSNTELSRLQMLKGFVLWGLLLSIPTLITLGWIGRGVGRLLQNGQQDKLAYKIRELESIERQITERG